MSVGLDGPNLTSTHWGSKSKINYNNNGRAESFISREEDSVNRISISKSSFKNVGIN